MYEHRKIIYVGYWTLLHCFIFHTKCEKVHYKQELCTGIEFTGCITRASAHHTSIDYSGGKWPNFITVHSHIIPVEGLEVAASCLLLLAPAAGIEMVITWVGCCHGSLQFNYSSWLTQLGMLILPQTSYLPDQGSQSSDREADYPFYSFESFFIAHYNTHDIYHNPICWKD